MGTIRLRFKAKRGTRREVFSAVVDTGADVTNLNLETACELGLDPRSAKQITMQVAGGAKLFGFKLDNVELSRGKRVAKLPFVFVPTEVRVGEVTESVARNDEQLIGHDFLQAAGAKLDYGTHELRGSGSKRPVSAHPKAKIRNATPIERAQMRAISCPMPGKRRR